jgi:metal-responsive CopG/Arc/MetJ family transcriptional regulator
MRVAISLPAPTLNAAERMSKRLGISRSQLYTRAVEAFVKAPRDVEIRESLAAVYGSNTATVDPTIDRAQADALREDW